MLLCETVSKPGQNRTRCRGMAGVAEPLPGCLKFPATDSLRGVREVWLRGLGKRLACLRERLRAVFQLAIFDCFQVEVRR